MTEYRHRDLYMPVFRGGRFLPDTAYANLDKITLFIQNAYHIQFENMDAYNRFKAGLGQTDVFSRRRGIRSGTFKIKQARGLGERWLFHGSQLKFHTAPNGSHVTGKLTLMLNPSRYLSHRIHEVGEALAAENPEQFLVAHLSALSPQDAVERCLHILDTAFSLDRQDNMIPARLYRAARPMQTIFDLYLGQVLAFIEETIDGALAQSQRPGSFAFTAPMQDWSVPNAEVYWEYSVSHAVSFVNGLRTFLMPQFSEAEVAEYLLPGEQVEQEDDRALVRRWAVNGNAPSLKLNLGSKDVELVIYAKDRVPDHRQVSGFCLFLWLFGQLFRKLCCSASFWGYLLSLMGVHTLVDTPIYRDRTRMRARLGECETAQSPLIFKTLNTSANFGERL